jgi:hypothetical protein
LFLEDIFVFIFSEKIFKNFFFQKEEKEILKTNTKTKKEFFKKFFLQKVKRKHFSKKKIHFFKKIKKKLIKNKFNKYNFSKLWVVKYNNFILITTFVFFYFKIKTLKKNQTKKKVIQKTPLIF